jgi:uncharacterized DUF497 family protein
MIEFDWDNSKAKANQRKHGVSFEEAQSVFYDDFAHQFDDPASPPGDQRFLMLGRSLRSRLLIVCHCERQEGEIIRIISARKATQRESKSYPGPK